MRRSLLIIVPLLVLGAVVTLRCASAQVGQGALPPAFHVVADVPLPGGTSRFDYQSLDAQAHRLYIAHLGASQVTVFDTGSSTVVGEVAGVAGVHGVLAVPELGRVYATATNANQVAVIDPTTLTVIATAPTGDYPDGLAYAPTVGKLYVSNEHGSSDTVIDAQSNQPVGTIPLGGEAGNTQFDQAANLIYVGVHQRNQLVSIDPQTDQIVGHYPLPGCEDPHGIYIDAPSRTAFVGCEANRKLVVVDLTTMQVRSEHAVGQSPDVLAFDPARQWLYVAAENGTLTVLARDESGIREIARGPAGPDAHSVAVNPETHHVYLPLTNVGGRPVLRELDVQP
jgi:YVTN family beta-propeller protein